MGTSAHAIALSQKHQLLDRQIEEEEARPGSDDMHIRKLKREKLKIKDQISKLGYQTS